MGHSMWPFIELGVSEFEILFQLSWLCFGGRVMAVKERDSQKRPIVYRREGEWNRQDILSLSKRKLSTFNWLSNIFLTDGIWARRLWKFWHWGTKGRSKGGETVIPINFGVKIWRLGVKKLPEQKWANFNCLLLCFCSILYIISLICKFSNH